MASDSPRTKSKINGVGEPTYIAEN